MNGDEIVLRVIFPTPTGLTPKNLHNIFEEIERNLLHSDEDDVHLAAAEFNLSPLIRDAALWRLRQLRNERLLIHAAQSGSVEIFAAVAATSYFVLERTIGESFKQGYTSSEMHRRLSDFIRMQLDSKFLNICERLVKSKMVDHVEVSEVERTADVTIASERKQAVPTIGQFLARFK